MSENLTPEELLEPNPIKNTWTIMVYLAGDNNLAEEMVYALKCMQVVGSAPASASGNRKYQVFAFYDAGVAPVALTIKDRATPKGVPKVQNLQKMAVNALEQEIKRAEAAHTEARRELDRRAEVHNAAKAHPDIKMVYQGSQPTVKSAGTSEADLQEAKDDTSLTKRRLKDAKSALRGGPRHLDSVQTSLSEFVIQTIIDHPAEHYMLVLSGHGSGAVGDFLAGNTRAAGLSVPDLRDSLAAVQELFREDEHQFRPEFKSGKIDIVGMDSCLMGMAEVAYEISPYVNYLVGAEGFEPNTGWPYDRVLNLFRKSPGKAPEDLAVEIVQEYIETYTSDYTLADVSTDHSALDLKKIDRFAEALAGERGLAPILRKAFEKEGSRPGGLVTDKVLLAHWESQGYKDEQHVDIWDFCDRLQARCSSIASLYEIVSACRKVKQAVQALVKHSGFCGPEFQHSHGLSIFFPWARMTDAAGLCEVDHYGASLGFAQHTQWDEFIREYHKATLRRPRPGVGRSHPSTMNRRLGLFTAESDATVSPGLRLILLAISAKPSLLAASKNENVKELSSNPNIRALSSNPAIHKLSSNPNIRALVRALSSNPNIRALSSNPNIRALSSNPNIRALVRALSSNPNIRALSSNPNIRALSSNPNIRALSSNPNIRALSSNPNIRALSSNPNIRALSSNPNIRALSSNPNIRALSSNPNIRALSSNPNIRMSGGGGDLPKMASMKNPPINWREPKKVE